MLYIGRYQLTSTPDYFRVIFYDLSLALVDACLSADSTRLVAIPCKHPNFLFVVNLPVDLAHKAALLKRTLAVASTHNTIAPATTTTTAPAATAGASAPLASAATTSAVSAAAGASINGLLGGGTRTVSFEPRFIGNLSMLGPARGVFGQPLRMTHISANTVADAADAFHLITWNDEGTGEYCVWTIQPRTAAPAAASVTSPAGGGGVSSSMPEEVFDAALKCEYTPRLLMSRAPVERAWLEVRVF